MLHRNFIRSVTSVAAAPLCLLAGGLLFGNGVITHSSLAASATHHASNMQNTASIGSNSPAFPVQELYRALKAAQTPGTTADKRTALIGPAVDQTFDLQVILERSVGKAAYDQIPQEERSQLLAAFRKFTVARYVSTFKPGTDAVFNIIPTPKMIAPASVIIQTTLGSKQDTDPDPTPLDYVMKQEPQGWRVVDILLDGSISQVAAQRSDFRNSLQSANGVQALIQSLNKKADDFIKE